MKTTIAKLLVMLAFVVNASAAIQYIDFTTPHGSGVYGDSWPVTATKINTNFGYLYSLILNGGLTNSGGGGTTNYYTVTTNLYVTQNNYSYPSTNIYTGAITMNVVTNIYSGTNYFNTGSNVYNTITTNFINNYYTGGTASNAIEKVDGGGTDTTITNTLTLVNTNFILGWNVRQIMTISTNAQGVYSTNIFTLVETNNFLTDSNGYVIVPYNMNSNAPIRGYIIEPPSLGGGAISTNTTVPNFDSTNGQITVQWRGEAMTVGGSWMQTNGGTATRVAGSLSWTTTGDNISIEIGGKWSFSCGLSFSGPWGLASFTGFSVSAPTTGDVNGIYDFVNYDDGWYGAPVSNGRMIGTVTLSGFPNTYLPPAGFAPAGHMTVPTVISNLTDYVVLKPVYDSCGGLIRFDIIGWNPKGNWNGLQYFTNAYGYNPIKASPCNPVTATNWFVYHQGVWFPINCIDELRGSDPWGADYSRSVEMWPLWDIVDIGTPDTGLNLNTPQHGQFSMIIGGTPSVFHFNFWWLDIYNHGLKAWAQSPHSDYAYMGWNPMVYDHQPTLTDEPRLGSLSGSWVSWATNTTAFTTNYFRLLILSGGKYNATNLPPVPPQLAYMYQPQSLSVITNITMTNNFFVVSNSITQKTPIYATTVLTAGADSSLVVNVAKAITSFNGTINTNQLAASINALLKTIGTMATTISNQQVQIDALFHQLNP